MGISDKVSERCFHLTEAICFDDLFGEVSNAVLYFKSRRIRLPLSLKVSLMPLKDQAAGESRFIWGNQN
jgi:hypothetical protein